MELRQLAEQSYGNNFTHLEDFNAMYNLSQQVSATYNVSCML